MRSWAHLVLGCLILTLQEAEVSPGPAEMKDANWAAGRGALCPLSIGLMSGNGKWKLHMVIVE